MALYRATAVLKHTNGLPKDAVSNTFHLTGPGTVGNVDDAETAALLVASFYNTVGTDAGQEFADFLAPSVSTTGHEVHVYDINVATGESDRYPKAPPLYSHSFDFSDRGTPNDGLPSECAICLSYKNTSSGTVPQARRRGRLYIGPLEETVLLQDATTKRQYVDPDVRTHFLVLAQDMHARVVAQGLEWKVYSRAFAGRFGAVKDNGEPKPDLPARAGSVYSIDEFWIDDAVDIQRRRGEASVNRSTASV